MATQRGEASPEEQEQMRKHFHDLLDVALESPDAVIFTGRSVLDTTPPLGVTWRHSAHGPEHFLLVGWGGPNAFALAQKGMDHITGIGDLFE